MNKIRENSPENFEKFFKNYGSILKEGVYYEQDMKEDIAGVLLFDTLLSEKKISLDDYLNILQGEEKVIYYITGKSRSEVLASPYMSQFRENKVDVLLLTDAIDEWMIGVFDEYKNIKLKPITASDVKLKEETFEEKEKQEKQEKEFKDILELVKNIIGSEKIEKVELNANL
jgi:molecular chaperone HtpG